jgi:hypothetical protein
MPDAVATFGLRQPGNEVRSSHIKPTIGWRLQTTLTLAEQEEQRRAAQAFALRPQ